MEELAAACSKGLLGDGSPCFFLVLEILQDFWENIYMTKIL